MGPREKATDPNHNTESSGEVTLCFADISVMFFFFFFYLAEPEPPSLRLNDKNEWAAA